MKFIYRSITSQLRIHQHLRFTTSQCPKRLSLQSTTNLYHPDHKILASKANIFVPSKLISIHYSQHRLNWFFPNLTTELEMPTLLCKKYLLYNFKLFTHAASKRECKESESFASNQKCKFDI